MKKGVSKRIKDIKGMITEYLPWLIIGLAILVIIFISILLLKDKGTSIIDYVKDLFRGKSS